VSTVSSLCATLDGKLLSSNTINIYTLLTGTHTLVVTAVNGLGTTSTQTLTFVVAPTLVGLEDAVTAGYTAGSITTSAEETTLLGDLENTKNTVTTDLNNFISALSTACKGSRPTVTATESSLLTNWADYVL